MAMNTMNVKRDAADLLWLFLDEDAENRQSNARIQLPKRHATIIRHLRGWVDEDQLCGTHQFNIEDPERPAAFGCDAACFHRQARELLQSLSQEVIQTPCTPGSCTSPS